MILNDNKRYKETDFMKDQTDAANGLITLKDSGHTWFAKDDFQKAMKDLEASRKHVKELEHSQNFMAVRLERLKELFRYTSYWNDVACILANGTISPTENPSYAQLLNTKDFRIKELEAKLKMYEEAASLFQGKIIDLEKKLAEMEDSLAKYYKTKEEHLLQKRTKITFLEEKLKNAVSLLNEAAPIMEKNYLRTKWFDELNKINHGSDV